MGLRDETVETYNRSAKQLAEYFKGIGSRVEDVELALSLAGNPAKPRIVEIGCGDGRDAGEIVKRAGWYEGFDISSELIKLAKQKVPSGRFKVADAMEYTYPSDLDVVFAFASLLHLDREEVARTLKSVHSALRPGGIFYISLKFAPEYKQELKEDDYGRRLFYFYNPELIEQLGQDLFKTAKINSGFVTGKNTQWFEIALQKA